MIGYYCTFAYKNNMERPIKIYRASAGAGKTFMLVYEYIKYLFAAQSVFIGTETDWKRNVHRSILAVTFTNKSTAEMKERIVSALHGLSKGEEQLYVEWLIRDIYGLKKIGIKETELIIKKIATYLLTDILHDFTSFRVQTIDGFFQQVVRSFAEELNLNSRYQVELDSNTILELAVDNMLDSLSDKGKEDLLEWLTDFSNDKISEAKSWNPRRDILQLSELITSETYMSHRSDARFDIEKLKHFKIRQKKIIAEFESKLKQLCEDVLILLNRYGFDLHDKTLFKQHTLTPFSYEYLIAKNFNVTKAFQNAAQSGDSKSWCKVGKNTDVDILLIESLTQAARTILEMCDRKNRDFIRYRTAKSIYRNLYILGILNEIDLHVSEICRDNDCVIISSTTDFLHKIIDGSDTPFIYEKTGVWTNHFMIDEFQDTSRLQWSNFVPLIADVVAHGNESLLVGDIKQSIYRWRNGDWNILYRGVEERFGASVDNRVLNENYRSCKNIVEFNNYLYSHLPDFIDNILETQLGKEKKMSFGDIYDAEQNVVKKNIYPGYVCCRFFDSEKIGKDWIEQSLDDVVNVLRRMNDYESVAILVRRNREAMLVADRLREEGIPFDSSEALCVADNQAVKLMVSAMRYILRPYESVYRADFMTLYTRVVKHREIGAEDFDLMSYCGNDYSLWEHKLMNIYDSDDSAGRSVNFQTLKQYPLIRQAQSINILFGLEEIDERGHQLYVRTFLDKLQEYCQTNSADSGEFLKYWEEKGKNVYISMPEYRNAVRISTIFKAKGLEFDTVFVPFLDWTMGIGKFHNIRLMNIQGDMPYDERISIVPVNIQSAKTLLDTSFRDDIVDEFFNICLDTLNVLYVATTRARTTLYINCEHAAEKTAETEISNINVSQILAAVLDGNSMLKQSTAKNGADYIDTFELGETDLRKTTECDKRKISDNNYVIDYPAASIDEVDSRMELNYTLTDSINDRISAKWGMIMHRLFECIESRKDVDSAIQSLIDNGEIDENQKQILLDTVDEVMRHEIAGQWYSGAYKVINETEIYDNIAGRIYRPDRLMLEEQNKLVTVVDYKFGEKNDEYHYGYVKQVINYMSLIKKMGYSVRGYIFYVKNMHIDEVSLE